MNPCIPEYGYVAWGDALRVVNANYKIIGQNCKVNFINRRPLPYNEYRIGAECRRNTFYLV